MGQPTLDEGADDIDTDDIDTDDDGCPVGPTTRWQGALKWAYEGKAPSSPATPFASRRENVAQPVYLSSKPSWDDSPYEHMGVGSSTRVDECGQWRLVDVDVELAEERVADYDAEVLREFGPEPSESVRPDVGMGDWVDGGLAVRTSWDADNCDGISGKDIWLNSNNYFDKISSSYNTTQRKMVWIVGGCSGVMIDDDATSTWALTAAHCVTDSNGDPLTGSMTVCTYGNVQSPAQCFSTLEVRVRTGNWDGSVEDDFAIVRINGRPGVGTMPLSQASDNVLDDFTHYDRGFTRWEDDCDAATVTNNSVTINDSFDGRHLWKTRGEVKSTPGNLLKLDSSGAKGMSGSPHYYCPNGASNCSSSSFVTAVQTNAWNPAWPAGYRMGGPKARTFRTWAINNID